MSKFNTLALAIASLAVSAICAAKDSHQLEEVNVTVSPLDKPADAVAAPVSVLSGETLRKAASATLGETLKNQPGVANASFGSGVGLPVIRGQSANRVKILNDNLDVSDASSTSADHAASVEPLLAERIEILRGPAALRYGSGAIGGVVNIIDGRIPTEVPEEVKGAVELRHDSANRQDASVFRFSGGAGQLAWYFDGVYRENDDTEIPGLAIVEHEEHDHDEDEGEHEEGFNTDGYVGNTNARAHSYSGGVSWITDSGYFGLSINKLENNYGIPLGTHEHHHEEEEHEEEDHEEESEVEAVRIDMTQTRYDLKGEHRFDSNYWDKMRLRIGYNDYEHVELEEDAAGTRYANQAWEGRLEITHDSGSEWRGAYGLQLSDKDFTSDEGAFIQPSRTRSAGLFTMKEREWGNWHLDLGARIGRVDVDPEYEEDRNFNLFSTSATLQYFLQEHQHISVGATRSERAPVAEELFADGEHLAEGTYLIGNSDLDKERSINLELGYHHHNEAARGWHAAQFEASVFFNRIGDYIYAQNTNDLFDEELPIYAYTNRDATFYGAEASVKFPLRSNLSLTLFGDIVRASFDEDIARESSDVPRMPPLRLGIALGAEYDQWGWEWRTTEAADQNRAGAYEDETDGYTRMDLSAHYNFNIGDSDAVIFASARNLLDEEIRNSTSLLRDYAPEAGRSIEAGVRFIF
ncbi:TonB-dependent receptor [Microbulbifer sp. OS29]|uniref:TonB-dependent receptor n=1 Tax=Microbulbifer okhotskensis TaxID=2926617 RepID=A0A9X2ENP8_9GAMM|nr:TonB-dependent receptor [Microbulbifer okhotskensis]MCO1335004.1 TonB-dependent receptor [Microbulbifer okhotskensis]